MKRKSIIAICIFAAAVAGLSSCGSKKNIVKDNVGLSAQGHGEQSNGKVPVTEKDMLASTKELQQQQFLKKVADNAVYNDNITSRIDFNLETGHKNVSVGGRLYMRRDDVIRIQFTVPLLGMEAGRIEFTKDYVMIVDRIHAEYIKEDYNRVDFLRNNGLNFNALQALFWNTLFVPGSERVTPSLLKEFAVKLVPGNALSQVQLKRDKMNYVWQADNAQGLIRQVDVTYGNGQTHVTGLYGSFKPLGVKQFPCDFTLDIATSATQKARKVKVNIKMNGLNTDSNWESRTTLSKKYKQVSVEDVMNKLMNL